MHKPNSSRKLTFIHVHCSSTFVQLALYSFFKNDPLLNNKRQRIFKNYPKQIIIEDEFPFKIPPEEVKENYSFLSSDGANPTEPVFQYVNKTLAPHPKEKTIQHTLGF